MHEGLVRVRLLTGIAQVWKVCVCACVHVRTCMHACALALYWEGMLGQVQVSQ